MMLYSAFLKSALRQVYGQPPDALERREGSGLVLVADGVGGLELLGTGLRYAAGAAGFPHAIRVVRWGHGLGRWHVDLTDVANHEAQAEAIAAEARASLVARPEAPVFLVGKSGGSGVVVRALERLPEGSIERAVLVAPALSPGYDLRRALGAVRREMVAFWSPLDLVVLGLGTRVFGTVDRVRGVSAGLVGFRPPTDLDEAGRAAYARLRQVRWHPRMAPTGYWGGHVGPDSPAFLRRYVLPLLAAEPAVDPNPAGGSSSRPDAPIT